jgi:hypothetical protein
VKRATGDAAVTTRGLSWQFFAYLGGMIAYAVHLLGGTAMVPLACELGTNLPLSALNWAVIGVAGASFAAGWSIRRDARARSGERHTTVAQRTVFLAYSGMLLNVLAIVIVLFAEVHVWTLDPCLPR